MSPAPCLRCCRTGIGGIIQADSGLIHFPEKQVVIIFSLLGIIAAEITIIFTFFHVDRNPVEAQLGVMFQRIFREHMFDDLGIHIEHVVTEQFRHPADFSHLDRLEIQLMTGQCGTVFDQIIGSGEFFIFRHFTFIEEHKHRAFPVDDQRQFKLVTEHLSAILFKRSDRGLDQIGLTPFPGIEDHTGEFDFFRNFQNHVKRLFLTICHAVCCGSFRIMNHIQTEEERMIDRKIERFASDAFRVENAHGVIFIRRHIAMFGNQLISGTQFQITHGSILCRNQPGEITGLACRNCELCIVGNPCAASRMLHKGCCQFHLFTGRIRDPELCTVGIRLYGFDHRDIRITENHGSEISGELEMRFRQCAPCTEFTHILFTVMCAADIHTPPGSGSGSTFHRQIFERDTQGNTPGIFQLFHFGCNTVVFQRVCLQRPGAITPGLSQTQYFAIRGNEKLELMFIAFRAQKDFAGFLHIVRTFVIDFMSRSVGQRTHDVVIKGIFGIKHFG